MNHVSSFAYNTDVDIRNTKFSNLVTLTYIVASKKSTKMFYYYSIATFSRNSVLPSLPNSI